LDSNQASPASECLTFHLGHIVLTAWTYDIPLTLYTLKLERPLACHDKPVATSWACANSHLNWFNVQDAEFYVRSCNLLKLNKEPLLYDNSTFIAQFFPKIRMVCSENGDKADCATACNLLALVHWNMHHVQFLNIFFASVPKRRRLDSTWLTQGPTLHNLTLWRFSEAYWSTIINLMIIITISDRS
jgi:hypothetical protein